MHRRSVVYLSDANANSYPDAIKYTDADGNAQRDADGDQHPNPFDYAQAKPD
jgi:hypothetical protein